MDFRLNPSIQKYLEANNLVNNTDIISLAGGVKNINDTENGCAQQQIDLSVKLHGINTLMLMNHTDCGAYGGSAKFASKEEEKVFHIEELNKARTKLTQIYPDLKIILLLGDTFSRETTNIEVVQ
jgi:carbonic anhydrase